MDYAPNFPRQIVLSMTPINKINTAVNMRMQRNTTNDFFQMDKIPYTLLLIFQQNAPATVPTGRNMGLLLIILGGIPLGAHLSQRVKHSNCADEFIEFGPLLPSQKN